MGIVSRWEYNKRRLLCIINTTKKWVFLLILVCSLFVLLLLTTKGWWERKRNETRFDTITVSLKAIWLVLCFNLISATGVCFSFSPREKYWRSTCLCAFPEASNKSSKRFSGRQQIARPSCFFTYNLTGFFARFSKLRFILLNLL